MSLFVAGAAFREVHVSLFVAGVAFGEVHVSLFVAGAAFGEVHVSLFVAGAACDEIWNDSRKGNVVIFNRICSRPVRKVALAARRVQFCVLWVGSFSDRSRIVLGSFSDRSRNGLGSVAHWKCHFSCFQYISQRFATAILRGRRSIW